MDIEGMMRGLDLATTKQYLTLKEAKDFLQRFIEANIRSIEQDVEEFEERIT